MAVALTANPSATTTLIVRAASVPNESGFRLELVVADQRQRRRPVVGQAGAGEDELRRAFSALHHDRDGQRTRQHQRVAGDRIGDGYRRRGDRRAWSGNRNALADGSAGIAFGEGGREIGSLVRAVQVDGRRAERRLLGGVAVEDVGGAGIARGRRRAGRADDQIVIAVVVDVACRSDAPSRAAVAEPALPG